MITAENSNSRGTNYAEFSREYQSLLQELAHYKQLAGSTTAFAADAVGTDAAAVTADVATATTRSTRSRATLSSSSSSLIREDASAAGTRSGPQRVLRGAVRTQPAAANM
jgi:hypothetical protein